MPADVKVIGFDDVHEAARLWPHHLLAGPVQMAEKAVRVLELRQAEPHRPQRRR
jgi:hypothetical protein